MPQLDPSMLTIIALLMQCKAAAWRACNKLNEIWKLSLPRKFKLRLFSKTVESVLLYSCPAWTITTKLVKELDGCYTCLLRCVLNIHWKQHITNAELYGDMPKFSQKIRERRTNFAGYSASEECVIFCVCELVN